MIDIELYKDFFFFVGSILGIVAFIITAIDPLLNDNREKWKRIQSQFDDDFFNKLGDVYETRSIPKKEFNRLWHFVNDINADKDYLRLKFPNKRIFAKHLNNFKNVITELEEEVDPPIWDDTIPPNGNRDRLTLSKNYFREHFDHHQTQTDEYLKHLRKTKNLVTKLRIEFRSMQTVANLSFIELLFKRLVIRSETKNLRTKLIKLK